jgi:hypothetical protein
MTYTSSWNTAPTQDAEFYRAKEYDNVSPDKKPAAVKIEACGVKGMQSKPWRKVFASQAAFEKWLDSEAAKSVTIYGTRDAE